MRVVGPNRDHTEFELDPVKAFRRARALDAMLRAGMPAIKRGVFRGSFAEFARQDEARMRDAAGKLNEAST
jgi:hypothetical protein